MTKAGPCAANVGAGPTPALFRRHLVSDYPKKNTSPKYLWRSHDLAGSIITILYIRGSGPG